MAREFRLVSSRERNFCKYILAGETQEKAVIKAKYNAKDTKKAARRLLEKPSVIAYLKSKESEIEEQTIKYCAWDRAKLIAQINDVIVDSCEKITKSASYYEFEEDKYKKHYHKYQQIKDAQMVLKCIEQIARLEGLYKQPGEGGATYNFTKVMQDIFPVMEVKGK